MKERRGTKHVVHRCPSADVTQRSIFPTMKRSPRSSFPSSSSNFSSSFSNDRNDTQRYSIPQQLEHTQLQIWADDLIGTQGFEPPLKIEHQLNRKTHECLSWQTIPPQWDAIYSHQPLGKPDSASNPASSRLLTESQVPEEFLDLFGASSSNGVCNAPSDTTSLWASDGTLLPCGEPIPSLSEPDLTPLPRDCLAYHFDEYQIDDALCPSDGFINSNLTQMGCWDESLDHQSMLDHKFRYTDVEGFSALLSDAVTERRSYSPGQVFKLRCQTNRALGTLDVSTSADYDSKEGLYLHSDHVQSDLSRSSRSVWSSAALNTVAPATFIGSSPVNDNAKTELFHCIDTQMGSHSSQYPSPNVTSWPQQGSMSWPSLTAVLEDDLARLDSWPLPDYSILSKIRSEDDRSYIPASKKQGKRRSDSAAVADEKCPKISKTVAWDHTASSQLEKYGYVRELKECLPSGRRNGPLNAEQGRKAAEIRKLHACLSCRLSKVPVSLSIQYLGDGN